MSLKNSIYRTISRFSSVLGGNALPKTGRRILLYHAVGSTLPYDPYGISIDRDLFLAHADFLQKIKTEWKPAPFGALDRRTRNLAVTFDDGYKDTLAVAAPELTKRDIPFTVFMTTDYLKDSSGLYMDSAQLRELASFPGAEIGAHGRKHVPLISLSDPDLREELSGTRKELEDILGKPVTSISYPHGAVDRRVREAAREAGFTSGGCSRFGLNLPGRDPLLLCRTEITALDTVEDLDLKVSGHWDWFRFRRRDPAIT